MNPIQNNLNKYFNKNSARVISYGMKLRYRDKRHSNSGQAMMIAVMFFLAGSLIVLGGATSPVLKDVKISRDIEKSKQSIYLSESGLEDVVYRVKNNMNFSNTESLVIGDITATTTIAVVGDKREIVSAGYKDNVVRTTKAIISEGNNTSFDYVLQSAAGGIEINDEAYVSGDVFSDTAIEGEFSNTITGNAISAGPSGLIRNIHITGSGYANTIASSTIDGNAYYQSIFGTSVGGDIISRKSDQALGTMPISDSSIEDMETNAQNGGVINSPCPYIINSNTTIGPVKVNCNLVIQDSAIVTLSGNVWVVGNLLIGSSTPIEKISNCKNIPVYRE